MFEAAGTGTILAGLVISRVRSRFTGGTILMAAAIGCGLAACLFTGTTSLPAASTGAFLWGAAGSVLGAVAVTTLQRVAPVHAHGRVMSISATLQSWAETIGLALGGVTLATLGVRPGALALAGVTLAAGLIGMTIVTAPPGRQRFPCNMTVKQIGERDMPTQFDFGFLVGLLVGEGHFGGDGRQPHVTLRMHVRHQAIFDWLQKTFPGSRVYGPYHHGGRDYLQWMARGAFLRDELAPVLDRFLSPSLDQHSFERYQLMKTRYPQLAAGPGAPVLPPDRSRRASSRQPARNETAKVEPQPVTHDPADFADLFAELREVWPN